MSMVSIDVSLEQIKQAMRQLPAQEKMVLWRLLDEQIDRPAIAQQFLQALAEIRQANIQYSEEEVMADAIIATQEVRRARHAQSRS